MAQCTRWIWISGFCLATVTPVAVAAPAARADQLARWPGMLDTFLVALLFVALGEEPGWRGFLLPRLQQRFAAPIADLVLGAIWALWHLPRDGDQTLPPRARAPPGVEAARTGHEVGAIRASGANVIRRIKDSTLTLVHRVIGTALRLFACTVELIDSFRSWRRIQIRHTEYVVTLRCFGGAR